VGRIVELAQIAGGDAANQLAGLAQRIAKNAAAIVASAEVDPELSSMLAKDATSFREVQSAITRSGASRGDGATLGELAKRAGAFDAGVAAVTLNMGRLVSAKQAARSVNNDAEALLADTTRLADVYEGSGRTRVPLWFAIIFAVLALGTLL